MTQKRTDRRKQVLIDAKLMGHLKPVADRDRRTMASLVEKILENYIEDVLQINLSDEMESDSLEMMIREA